MVRPALIGRALPILTYGLGYSPDLPTDTLPPPPDLATDAAWFFPVTVTESTVGSYVQSKGAVGNGNPISVVLDATPTEGNLLLAFATSRSLTTPFTWPSGWTVLDSDYVAMFGHGGAEVAAKVAGASESATITVTAGADAAGLSVSEYSGTWDVATFLEAGDIARTSGSATPDVPTVTPASGQKRLLFAVASYWDDLATITWPTGFTQRYNGSTGAAAWRGHAHADYIVDPTSGSYGGGTLTTNRSTDWKVGMYSLPDASSGFVWLDAFNVNDGLPATYDGGGTFDGTEDAGGTFLRGTLADAYRLASAVLRLGIETSGSKTITVQGSNAANYSGAVTLGSVTFTATGSYTAQDVTFDLPATTGYRYLQFTLTTPEGARTYEVEVYPPLTDVTEHGDLTGRDSASQHPASAVSVSPTVLGAATVQAALVALEAADSPDTSLVTVAASGTTETIDVSVARTYDVTLTDDCTITLTGSVTAEAHYLTLILRQGAAPPHLVTWPGSVVWADGAPVLSTAANAVDVITLFTLDGGSVWFGFPTGGADLASTVVSETAFGQASAAGTAVTASKGDHTHGTPANPVTEAAVQGVGRWEVIVSGSAPPVATTNEAADDWIVGWVSG